jgi:hypothetical protein
MRSEREISSRERGAERESCAGRSVGEGRTAPHLHGFGIPQPVHAEEFGN